MIRFLLSLLIIVILTPLNCFATDTVIWPGVGEIPVEELPDDGTGRSGVDVLEQTPVVAPSFNENGTITIPVPVDPEPSPVVSAPDPSPVPSQEPIVSPSPDVLEEIPLESLPTTTPTVVPVDSIPSLAPVTGTLSVSMRAAASDIPLEEASPEPVAIDKEYIEIIIVALGFISGMIGAFAIFKHYKTR